MSNKQTNLIWIDLEMSGLDTDTDQILEIATIVTDCHLEQIAQGPVCAIYQPDTVLDGMDAWNQTHHSRSGLIGRVRASSTTLADAMQQSLDFLRQHVDAGASPMCGNSICQDRRFLHRHMPELEQFFHYRNLDVSSINILAQLWVPEILKKHHKVSSHQALEDIQDSIAELKFYREHFFHLEQGAT